MKVLSRFPPKLLLFIGRLQVTRNVEGISNRMQTVSFFPPMAWGTAPNGAPHSSSA